MQFKIAVTLILWGAAGSATLAQGTLQAQATTVRKNLEKVQRGGKANYLAKFTGTHTLGNSGLAESVGGSTTIEGFQAGSVSALISNAPGIVLRATSTAIEGRTDGNIIRGTSTTQVAGIFSAKPGMLGFIHKIDKVLPKEEIPLAVGDIVPCKVSSGNRANHGGELLATSSSRRYAMS